jgi:signal transduction histidine kinase
MRKSRGPKDLGAVLKKRGDVFAGLTHELRNPMHALALQLASIRRDAARAGLNELVGRLDRAEATLSEYLDRATILLELAQHEAREYPMDPRELDFTALIMGIVEAMHTEAAFHGLDLHLETQCEVRMRLDPRVAAQVVSNLILSAIKYARGNRVLVRIDATQAARLELTIEDDGIPGAVSESAYPIPSHPRPSGQRLEPGLGLWIVTQLVRALDGQVLVEPSASGGDRYRLSLPRIDPSYLGSHGQPRAGTPT